MVKKVELRNGTFYKCGAYLRDCEYGIQYSNDLGIFSKSAGKNLPIYVICENGLIKEMVSGEILSYSPTGKNYSTCSYEQLKGLSDYYLNIETLSEVSKMEVAAFLKNIENDGLVSKYVKVLEKAREEQQIEIKYFLKRNEPVSVSIDETEKIISKYLSRHNRI